MIPVNDKRRQWALQFGQGYFTTSAHSASMIVGLGLVFVLILGMAGVAVAAASVDDSAAAGVITANVALVAAREKLEEKQKLLSKIFEEAESDSSDGKPDFRKVKCLGEGLTSADIAKKVREVNEECGDLYDECENLAEAEKGSGTLEKIKGLQHPGPGGPGPDGKGRKFEAKSFGDLITEHPDYIKHFVEDRSKNGMTLKFDDAWPSDILARGAGIKTLMETAAGFDPRDVRLPGFTDAVTRPLQIRDIVPVARVSTDTIEYMEETTRTHAAAEKAEGGTYAESTFTFTARTSNVRKITDSLPITDEQLEDVPFMNSYVNGRLTFGVLQRLDTAILTGAGTGVILDGIKNVSGIQTQAKGSDSAIDAVRKTITLIRVTGRAMPTHVLLHSTDWQNVELTQTADGLYILGSPTAGAARRLWGLPVVEQEIDSAGTGYVGSFQPSWISLFERRGIDIQVGYTGSQFVEGKKTVRADMRVALIVFRPAAFASVTGL